MVKTIHTLNFWNYSEKFPLYGECIQSWKKFGNGAEIKVWTESDKFMADELNSSPFIKYIWEKYKNDEYTRKIATVNYLKIFILYHFGGMFLDADIELKSEFSFSKDFTMCHSLNISPCVPVYFTEPHSEILLENLNFYNDVQNLTNDIYDWNMSDAIHFSESSKVGIKSMVANGIDCGPIFNHWISCSEKNGMPSFFSAYDVDEVLYFSDQAQFDKCIWKIFQKNISNLVDHPKFIFISENINSPFLYSTSFPAKIYKADKDSIIKYFKFYMHKNVVFGDNNEVQFQ